MIRAWIGIALLSGAWLLGLGTYDPGSQAGCVVLVLVGMGLLGGVAPALPDRRQVGLALFLLPPVVWFLPWPWKAAAILLALGLAVELAPARAGCKWLGCSAVAASAVLLAQGAALAFYADDTARSHDLPGPLAWLIGEVARLLGADVAVEGSTVAIHSIRQVHRLSATWDLLVDPATVAFFVGGLVLLGLAVRSRLPAGRRWLAWLAAARTLTAALVVWLPLRVGLLVGLYLHRAMVAPIDKPLAAMNQFLSPWVLLGLLGAPVGLAAWLIRLPEEDLPAADSHADQERSAVVAGLGLIGLAVGIFAVVWQWEPVGRPKAGRVMVVERHSTWEPTTEPYSTTRYGEAGSYNYAAIYEYCSRYFEMSRLLESDRIDDATLAKCDVLVIKIPTARYGPQEVEAVVRFVERGGGLLLVGDHTNVFRSSTCLNDIARRFGFAYRNDLLFCVGSPYDQLYRRPAAPHPSVAHLPPMWFAVSCSIDPGRSLGRAAIQSTGLWSLPPQYNNENYHPDAEYRPEMRYGAFIQLWAAHRGAGRVLAFTDSTIFSNFCVFQPGKAELMLGMLDWLNRRSVLDDWRLRRLAAGGLVAAALALLGWGLRRSLRARASWIVLVAAGLLGWTLGSTATVAAQAWSMPAPEAKRPMVRVVIDRTVSEAPLARGAFNEDEAGEGYGLLEQWIGRLGYFTVRREGQDAFTGDLLVMVCPTKSASQAYREELLGYVRRGGKVLVVDSPESEGSTANSLLWPFGMSLAQGAAGKGQLSIAGKPTGIFLGGSCRVDGGTSLASVDGVSVAAQARYGRGSVTALGFGSLFNDAGMGDTWMAEPDASRLRRFGVLFTMIQRAMQE